MSGLIPKSLRFFMGRRRKEAETVQAHNGFSVLIVDDDPSIVSLVRFVLEGMEFDVDAANDALTAYSLMTKKVYHLVICDIVMPRNDGFSLLTAVRGKPQFDETPFLFLSASDPKTLEARALARGADAFMQKPFTKDLLLNTVDGILKRKQQLKS